MLVGIGKIADVQIGYQARESFSVSSEGTHYLIQPKDLREDLAYDLLVSSMDRFTPSRNPGPYVVTRGDVLFLARGRRRSATVLEELPGDAPVIALYHFFILRLNSSIVNAHFLAWLINEGSARDSLARVASGTTIPFVAKQDFSALQIDLPPMKVQEDVASVYRLSMREAQLARQLEAKRLEIMELACRSLTEPSGGEA
jgi:hypothetical protein